MPDIVSVFRTEKKYHITPTQIVALKRQLNCVMQRDENANGEQGYLVRTVYFDSYGNDDYMDKVNGLQKRKKIRLRIYDTSNDTAKLELKQKDGALQRKQSLMVSRQTAISLLHGDFSDLLTMTDPFALRLYSMMQKGRYRPCCMLTYQRLAFILPSNRIRVTIDSDIRYSNTNFDLFSQDAVLIPYRHLPILEVKYDGFLLDPVRKALASIGLQETAISKYVMARQDIYA